MGRNDGKYNTASPDRYLLLKDFAQKNKQFPTDAERVLWVYMIGDLMLYVSKTKIS